MGKKAKRLRSIGRQIASCDNKVQLKTLRAALLFMGRRRLSQRAYNCPICGQWHLTSQEIPNG